MDDPIIAGVELGGTKAVAVLARGRSIIDRFRLPTTTPTETLSRIADQLARWHVDRPFEALGVGSFGPVRLDPEAEDYGRILDTPKPDWSGADVIGALTRGHDRPCRIDTDVNAAVLAEKRWGAARDVASACYLTLGTGVGGGLLIDGAPVRGALHPEVGHLRMRRATGDAFAGICPFHGDCVEGLVSGPALHARFGRPGEHVDDDDPRWSFFIHDVAALISALSLTASPGRVILGGGIGIGRAFLLGQIRTRVLAELNGYLPHVTPATIDRFIVTAELGEEAGPLGAVSLGQAAYFEGVSRKELRLG